MLKRLKKNVRKSVEHLTRPRTLRDHAGSSRDDLGAFTGLGVQRLESHFNRVKGYRLREEFEFVRPRTQAELTWFYRASGRYFLGAPREPWDLIREAASQADAILDYGAGPGLDAFALLQAGYDVTYFDVGIINAAYYRFRCLRHGLVPKVIEPYHDDGTGLRFDALRCVQQSFDVIVLNNVLEHIPDYPLTLTHLISRMRPRGRIVECTPFRRPKQRIFARPPALDMHLDPARPLAAVMAEGGLQPRGNGIWDRVD